MTAGKVHPDDPSLAVSHGAEGIIGRFTGNEIRDLHTIAPGIDIGVRGLVETSWNISGIFL
jgi:hypothetical protein